MWNLYAAELYLAGGGTFKVLHSAKHDHIQGVQPHLTEETSFPFPCVGWEYRYVVDVSVYLASIVDVLQGELAAARAQRPSPAPFPASNGMVRGRTRLATPSAPRRGGAARMHLPIEACPIPEGVRRPRSASSRIARPRALSQNVRRLRLHESLGLARFHKTSDICCYSFLSWSIIVGAARRESSETMPNDCLRTR
jgi:hypothetical protein